VLLGPGSRYFGIPYSRPLVIARPPSLSSIAPEGPRVKKAARLRMPPPPRSLLAARRRPRRALNVAITADYWERRLDDGASSPPIIRVFDVADQITDDF
jgi:hypothetical protein